MLYYRMEADCTILQQADRVERADLELLLPEDIVFPEPEKHGRKIGFVLA